MDFTRPMRRSTAKQRVAGIAVAALVHAVLLGALLQMRSEVRTPEPPSLQLQLLRPPPRVALPPIEARLRLPPPPHAPLPSIVIAEPAAPIPPAPVAVAVASPAAPTISAVPTSPTVSMRDAGVAGVAIGDSGTAGMVRARMDLDRSPNSCRNPAFPASEDREAYGVAAVSLLIGPDGSVKGSRIDASSGHPLLDQATVEAFARCLYYRGTIRGKPAHTWYRIKWLWFLPRSQR
jgi:protein TonB